MSETIPSDILDFPFSVITEPKTSAGLFWGPPDSFYILLCICTQGPDDSKRRFVISFYMVDQTIAIYEPPVSNSGFVGGVYICISVIMYVYIYVYIHVCLNICYDPPFGKQQWLRGICIYDVSRSARV